MHNFNEILRATNYAFKLYAIPNFLVVAFLLAIGILVFIKNKKSAVNISFLVLCLSASIWIFGNAMAFLSLNETTALFWSRFSYMGVVFVSTNVYAFSVAYLKLKRQKRSVILGYLVSFIFMLLVRTDYFVNGVKKCFWGYSNTVGNVEYPFLGLFLVLMFASLYNFYKGYKSEKLPIEREHRKYLFIGFLIAYLAVIDYLPDLGVEIYQLGYIPVTVCISIFGYAIVKYRLMDIETVVHRTITYALLSFIILIPYAGIVFLIQVLLRGAFKIEEVLTTGFFVLFLFFLISPLKDKTQHFVDRLFYRDKYDYRKTLENFAKKLSLFLDSPNLLPTITGTIAETMHLDKVSLLLFDEEAGCYTVRHSNGLSDIGIILTREDPFVQFLQSYGEIVEKELLIIDPSFTQARQEGLQLFERLQAELVIPLIVQSGLIGILGMGKKLSEEAYKTEDINLLSTIGQEIAVAINNRLLYEGLEKANKELKEAQAQLIQSAKMAAVGQLGAGVAHELNNPLGGILGYAQLLLEKLNRPEFSPDDFKASSKYIESIEREASRCKKIVENLLKFSRRPVVAKPEPLDIAQALEETLSIIGHQLKIKNVNLITDFKPDLAKVVGITNQLQQVFTNLILNAQQATPEGGELRITASNLLDEKTKLPVAVKIEFTDTGCGISEENLKHVFEPFFTTKQKDKGTGLGLAVSYQIIQDHKGSIDLKSQVNKGTTITITLPAA